jgi:hypothetical protein
MKGSCGEREQGRKTNKGDKRVKARIWVLNKEEKERRKRRKKRSRR